MMSKESIKRDRLVLLFAITFILVDTCPYPNWPPGFIQTGFQNIQHTLVSKSSKQ